MAGRLEREKLTIVGNRSKTPKSFSSYSDYYSDAVSSYRPDDGPVIDRNM